MTNYKVTMSEKQYNDYLLYLTTAPNIQDVKKPNKKEFGEDNKHPTIKPVKLMEWLIKLTTNEGDLVLDPFSGSGTTLQAATNLNRTAVGIELQPEYIATIKSRAPNAIVKLGDCIDVMKKMDANSVDALFLNSMDLSVPLKPSVVWFIKGTRTFVNGYTKDVSTNKVKINGQLRGIYSEVFPPKDGRFPMTVLCEDYL